MRPRTDHLAPTDRAAELAAMLDAFLRPGVNASRDPRR